MSVSPQCRRIARDIFYILKTFGGLSLAAAIRDAFRLKMEIGVLRRLSGELRRERVIPAANASEIGNYLDTMDRMLDVRNWVAISSIADSIEAKVSESLFNRLAECEIEARK